MCMCVKLRERERKCFVLPVSVCLSLDFHCLIQTDGPTLTPQRVALDAGPPACFPVGEGEEEGENTDEEEQEECKQCVNCIKEVQIKAFRIFNQKST